MVISYEECPLICHFPVDSRGWRKCGIGVHAPNPPLLALLSCNGPFLPSRGLVREGGSRQSVLIQIGCIRGQSQSFLLKVWKVRKPLVDDVLGWVGIVDFIHLYSPKSSWHFSLTVSRTAAEKISSQNSSVRKFPFGTINQGDWERHS